MYENKIFKRQIETLIETEVELLDMVQQQGKIVDKFAYARDFISSAVKQLKTKLGAVVEFLTCESIVNVSAENEWKEKNLNGCYNMVETVNGRPAYKRAKETDEKFNVYLWYYDSRYQAWTFTKENDFIDRKDREFMHIMSKEYDVKNLDPTGWYEWNDSHWDNVNVTIVSNTITNYLLTSLPTA
jgi:hypothetical protein